MTRYKVYALILGSILVEDKIFDCEIEKMDKSTQVQRGFTPLRGELYDDGHYDSYLASPYLDPRIIKTNWIITYEFEESRVNYALGKATRKFNKVCAHLSLAYQKDFKERSGFNPQNFSPYHYQINKIYEITPEGEVPLGYDLINGSMSLPGHPGKENWHHKDTSKYLEQTFYCEDATFQKAIKYLYSANTGYSFNNSVEKVTLDHFKTIEVIFEKIAPFKKNQKPGDNFAQRTDRALKILDISDPEVSIKIKSWYKSRSDEDIAHAKEESIGDYLPNQFPIPDDVAISDLRILRSSIAALVLSSYFETINVNKEYL